MLPARIQTDSPGSASMNMGTNLRQLLQRGHQPPHTLETVTTMTMPTVLFWAIMFRRFLSHQVQFCRSAIRTELADLVKPRDPPSLPKTHAAAHMSQAPKPAACLTMKPMLTASVPPLPQNHLLVLLHVAARAHEQVRPHVHALVLPATRTLPLEPLLPSLHPSL